MHELGQLERCCLHCQADNVQMEFAGVRGQVICCTHKVWVRYTQDGLSACGTRDAVNMCAEVWRDSVFDNDLSVTSSIDESLPDVHTQVKRAQS
eukprot:4749287-Karenia_brevis.AAC.1